MFYDNFVNLCASIGKSPSAVAVEIGFQKSAVSRWKKSGATPTDANLQRIAKYFGVSVEYLLGNEQKEKPSGRTSEELDEVRISGGSPPPKTAPEAENGFMVRFLFVLHGTLRSAKEP